MDVCGKIWPNRSIVEPIDVDGCIKQIGHAGAHVFIDERGAFIQWEEDVECTCGCWVHDEGYACLIYKEIEPLKITNK